ncbi:glycosyltransferase [Hippea sp. KM1]|uniref:glycosyltransferase n=1 Tax=Hippea sp. KM1 TaxID=944481 RepID=UPI00046D4B99|nr:glycosyltransferase [Hippea sp. KM1]
MRPLVSVSSACYNHKEFLDEYFDSVLSQTYKNIEIVIGDDASIDGSQEILLKYKKKYPNKIKLILNEKNLGITQNSINVLKACRGKYIALVATDDLMLPAKIEKQVEVLEKNPNINICYHDLEVIFENSNKKMLFSEINQYTPKRGAVKELIKYGTFVGACSVMIRRENIPSYFFDDRIKIASDWKFLIDVIREGEFYYINEVLGKYRRHSNNITLLRTIETLDDHILTCGILIQEYPEYVNEIKYRLANILFEKSMQYFRMEKYLEAKKNLEASIKIKKIPKNVLFYFLNKCMDFSTLEKLKRKFKKSLNV